MPTKEETGLRNRQAVQTILAEHGPDIKFAQAKPHLKRLGVEFSENTWQNHKNALRQDAMRDNGGRRVASLAKPTSMGETFTLDEVTVALELDRLAKRVGSVDRLNLILAAVEQRHILDRR